MNQGMEAGCPHFHHDLCPSGKICVPSRSSEHVRIRCVHPYGKPPRLEDTAARFSLNHKLSCYLGTMGSLCSETSRQEEDLALWQRGLAVTTRR